MQQNHLLSQMVQPLLSWYDAHARMLPWREEPTPYRVWISEIMLQQTRVEAVKPYFERFIQQLPDIKALANASEQQLLKLWEGLGYYNRVRNLQKAAVIIMAQHQGQIPASQELLLKLPGIGKYSAGAICSIAFGLPIPAIDGNVLRVISRITLDASDIAKDSVKQKTAQDVQRIIPTHRAGDFNQALMELGATVCLPNGEPKCELCPLCHICMAYQQNVVALFPVKSPKKPRKIEKRTVLLLISQHTVALQKRKDSGLLAGLWEFPNVDGSLSLPQLKEKLQDLNISYVSIIKLKPTKHIFTHIEWRMSGYMIVVDVPNPNYLWPDTEQLQQNYTIPTAFQAYYQKALETINEA